MQNIEYRALNTTNNKFEYFTIADIFTDDYAFSSQSYFTDFQQYTGLKDSNGIKIFENDIIKIANGKKPITARISYTLTYMGWTIGHPENNLEAAHYDTGGYVKKSALCDYVVWGEEHSPRLTVIGNTNLGITNTN